MTITRLPRTWVNEKVSCRWSSRWYAPAGFAMSMFARWRQTVEPSRFLQRRSSVSTLWFFAICLLGNAHLAFSQTFVTLRLIDAESGKPLKGISVGIMVPDENESRGPNEQGVTLLLVEIDKQGRGKFRVPEPPPQYVEFAGNGALHGCSDRKLSIEDALRTGLVAAYHYDPTHPRWCTELKAQASAKPGEIVIFDKPMTNLDSLLQRHP